MRVGRLWRLVVRLLAPREEWSSICDDLDEDVARLAASQGPAAARRFVRWQVMHSMLPWLSRRVREAVTRMGRMPTMLFRGLAADVRLAARRLRHQASFSVLAVATLTVGIGAVSTVFSLAHALWLKPLPYSDPGRLVWIDATHASSAGRSPLTAEELEEYERPSAAFTAVAGFSYGAGIARVGNEPVRIVAYAVSPNLFDVLGVAPAMGRTFLPSEATGSSVVVLSHRTWVRRFHSDPDIIGKTMTMYDEPFDIVGVMPEGFAFPWGQHSELWMPSDLVGANRGRGRVVQAIARLAPGRTLDDATTILAGRAASLPSTGSESAGDWTARVRSADVTASASSRLAFQALLGLVALFLVVACTNLAGLMIARNASRRTELAVCLSLGAPRWRLARTLFAETVLLAGVGCAAGVALASQGARLLTAYLPATTAGLDQVSLNSTVLTVTVGLSMMSSVFIAVFPVFGLRKLRASDAVAGLRSVTASTSRAQTVVVLVEMTVAVVLLVGASAMSQALAGALARDRGYEPRDLQAINITLPFSSNAYEQTEGRASAFEDLIGRVAALPGVQSAAATTGFPGSKLGILGGAPIAPPGGGTPTLSAIHAASIGYFETMGIPVRAGRVFDRSDASRAAPVVVVDDRLAALFPEHNPLGARIPLSIFGAAPVVFEVVGVVGSISLNDQTIPRVFVPLSQVSPYWIDLVFREQPGSNTMSLVRQTLRDAGPNLLLENESSFQSIIMDSLALERAQRLFAGIVGVLSTVVAGIGLYALMTFLTTQRRREFGLRLALGSQPYQLCRTVLGGATRLVALGVATGLGTAYLLARALDSLVFGLTSVGVAAYLWALAVVVVVAGLAVWVPARRVLRTDPLIALRIE